MTRILGLVCLVVWTSLECPTLAQEGYGPGAALGVVGGSDFDTSLTLVTICQSRCLAWCLEQIPSVPFSYCKPTCQFYASQEFIDRCVVPNDLASSRLCSSLCWNLTNAEQTVVPVSNIEHRWISPPENPTKPFVQLVWDDPASRWARLVYLIQTLHNGAWSLVGESLTNSFVLHVEDNCVDQELRIFAASKHGISLPTSIHIASPGTVDIQEASVTKLVKKVPSDLVVAEVQWNSTLDKHQLLPRYTVQASLLPCDHVIGSNEPIMWPKIRLPDVHESYAQILFPDSLLGSNCSMILAIRASTVDCPSSKEGYTEKVMSFVSLTKEQAIIDQLMVHSRRNVKHFPFFTPNLTSFWSEFSQQPVESIKQKGSHFSVPKNGSVIEHAAVVQAFQGSRLPTPTPETKIIVVTPSPHHSIHEFNGLLDPSLSPSNVSDVITLSNTKSQNADPEIAVDHIGPTDSTLSENIQIPADLKENFESEFVVGSEINYTVQAVTIPHSQHRPLSHCYGNEIDYEVVEISTTSQVSLKVIWPYEPVFDNKPVLFHWLRIEVVKKSDSELSNVETKKLILHKRVPSDTHTQFVEHVDPEVVHILKVCSFYEEFQGTPTWQGAPERHIVVERPTHAVVCAHELQYKTFFAPTDGKSKTTTPSTGLLRPLVQLSWDFPAEHDLFHADDSHWIRWGKLKTSFNFSLEENVDSSGWLSNYTMDTADAHVRKIYKEATILSLQNFEIDELYGIQICAFHAHILPLDLLWQQHDIYPLVLTWPPREEAQSSRHLGYSTSILVSIIVVVIVMAVILSIVFHYIAGHEYIEAPIKRCLGRIVVFTSGLRQRSHRRVSKMEPVRSATVRTGSWVAVRTKPRTSLSVPTSLGSTGEAASSHKLDNEPHNFLNEESLPKWLRYQEGRY